MTVRLVTCIRFWRAPLAALVCFIAAAVLAFVLLAEASADEQRRAPAVKPRLGTELPELRTRYSRTFQRKDGHGLVARISAQPVNYRDGAGDFQPIDNTLQ